MKYRSFGRLGWEVAEIGFGGWAIGGGWGGQSDEDSIAALHRALDLGCNFIDTAQGYGDGRSERIIAQVLKERGGNQRVYVATKIPPAPGNWPPSPYDDIEERYSAAYLRERLERSLRELRTECIDVLQLHTWTRAWNRNPTALATLRQFKQEGKILAIGVSTPEHDQDSVLDLIRGGWVDSVQLIYNIFEQEAQAELLPAAAEYQVAIIVRVALDEGALTGKLTPQTVFGEGDFRRRYFAGDRLQRTIDRVEAIRATVGSREPDLATAALKFALKPASVSTVISGIRNTRHAEMNLGVSAQAPMNNALERDLRAHAWRRAFWFAGK